MVQVKDLTELTIGERWAGVKDEEDWWGEFNERTRQLVKLILESSLEQELLEELQANWYKRSPSRRGYRNGYYQRTLYCSFGIIRDLRVPRARTPFTSKLLPHYQRRHKRVDQMVRDMFLAGVSTRRVGDILAAVGGEKLSAQTVSNIARILDQEVGCFHSRPLADVYQYLFLDGISLKVRGASKVHRRMALCAYGITLDGKREMIAFRQGSDESEAKWEAFLTDLYKRGLEGKTCKLIVTDGCPGLHKALETAFPYVPRERCWVHKMRNVANKLRRRDQKNVMSGLHSIYAASCEREARQNYRGWKTKWETLYPDAVSCLEKDLDELFTFYRVPLEHRIKVRTTNVIERAFREVRRRIRPMSCFTNSQSVDRIIYGVISHLNKAWKGKPLLEFTQDY